MSVYVITEERKQNKIIRGKIWGLESWSLAQEIPSNCVHRLDKTDTKQKYASMNIEIKKTYF